MSVLCSKEMSEFSYADIEYGKIKAKDIKILISMLEQSLQVVYSGSINPIINVADKEKIKAYLDKTRLMRHLQREESQVCTKDQKFVFEYERILDIEKKGELIKGFWSMYRLKEGAKP